MNWRKSSYSGNGGSSCVETASDDHGVHVRDTKQHGRGPVLGFTPGAWHDFITDIKSGRVAV